METGEFYCTTFIFFLNMWLNPQVYIRETYLKVECIVGFSSCLKKKFLIMEESIVCC
jgi:hypothetical protein